MAQINSIRFSEKDNIAVALENAQPGDVLAFRGGSQKLLSALTPGFKAALCDIDEGAAIVKYGEPIGRAKRAIKAGERVHDDNISSGLSGEMNVEPWKKPEPLKSDGKLPEFTAYRRKNGKVGIRNDLWIIPTVGCVNGLLKTIIKDYPVPKGITAVRVLEHPWGCSQLSDDLNNTRNILIGLAHNPNAAGVLIASLGCENLRLDSMKDGLSDVENLKTVVLQDELDEKTSVLTKLDELASAAVKVRTPCEASDLTFGIKCGGSDALSSITANPLLGRVTDRYTSEGGTVIMGEVPEMFGAEKGILARCATQKVYDDLVTLLQSFRDYFIAHNQPVFENPSPGNRAGGISTLEEKSLGAVSKSGHSIVTDVLKYGSTSKTKGLNVVFSPGNDLVSCTALAAAGAVMILFTTGRGTPFGTVVPTLKVATNAPLAAKKKNWIDFDASAVMTEGMPETVERLIEKMTNTANGAMSRNEENGVAGISIFKDGVIL